MAEFAIVIHHREPLWDARDQAERDRILKKYFEWMDALREENVYAGGFPLEDQRESLGGPVDGPFTETKEIVGGVVRLDAPDWETAREWTKRCPALEIGDRVELCKVASHVRPE